MDNGNFNAGSGNGNFNGVDNRLVCVLIKETNFNHEIFFPLVVFLNSGVIYAPRMCRMYITLSYEFPVKEQIFEQASNTLHHINRAKLFTENSAIARLRDILRG